MQWTGADRELAHSLLLARHFQITSIEFEVFRFRPSESSMLGAALQFCACAALCRDRTWSSGLWLSSRFSNLSEPFARHAGAL
jgi:hypothetical protein